MHLPDNRGTRTCRAYRNFGIAEACIRVDHAGQDIDGGSDASPSPATLGTNTIVPPGPQSACVRTK
jgi:hypothetical protein